MTEVILYFAYHLGFENIHTIGWDFEKPGTTISNHFYEKRDLVRKAESMENNEIEKNILASLKVYEWLREKGVSLFVSNHNSYVHDAVPRKILEQR